MRRTKVDPRFPARLRRLREDRRLSQRHVAYRVYIARSYVSGLENAKRTPSRHLANLLDAALDAGGELAALVTEEEVPAPRRASSVVEAEARTLALEALAKAATVLRVPDSAPPGAAAVIVLDLAVAALGIAADRLRQASEGECSA